MTDNANITAARAARRKLAAMPQRAADLLRAYRQERLALEQRQDVFGIPRRTARAALREKHLADVAALREDYDRAAEQLQDAIRKARHELPAVDPLAWQRLQSAIAGKTDPFEAETAAMARLERAHRDGDTSMLVAGAVMLDDHLASLSGHLAQHNADLLAIRAGDEHVATAVQLAQESESGLAWTATALSLVGLEVQKDDAGAASILPTYESRDVFIEPGAPPDYQAHVAAAARAAGVR